MSHEGRGSTEILYKALYDDEEYQPWTDCPSNNQQFRRRQPTHIFVNGIPSWNNKPTITNSLLARGSSQDKVQSHELVNCWSSSQLEDRNIKLQWEARANELGVSTGTSRAIESTIRQIKAADSMFTYDGEKVAMNYPKWDADRSDNSCQNTQYPGHHSPHCSLPTTNLTTIPSANGTTWEYNSLYSNLDDCNNFETKPYSENPLSDRVDEFFTTIPEERRFTRVTMTNTNSSNDTINTVESASSSDVMVTTEISEDDSSVINHDNEEESCTCDPTNPVLQGEERLRPSENSSQTQNRVKAKAQWKGKVSKPRNSRKRKREPLKVKMDSFTKPLKRKRSNTTAKSEEVPGN